MTSHLRIAQPVPGAERIEFRAGGARLKGRLFLPGQSAKAAIVINGATGVPQGYYKAFAAWLAEQGYACLTYDYRDFGASATNHVRHSRATMSDWGVRDQPAAQAEAERRFPDVPIWIIGHSLGGLMLPFHPGADRVERLIAVASGPVHVSDHPWSYRPLARAFWSPVTRGIAHALGYLPGRRLGLGPDLPLGVYKEWRRWCTTPGFYLTDAGGSLPMPNWATFRGRMKVVAVADDAMVPPQAVWRLMQHYPEAQKRQLLVRPANFGLRRVGHIAAFSQQSHPLWPALIA